MAVEILARVPLILLALATQSPAQAADADVAIVFAVDASASIDHATAELQREGHAAAICSPDVVAAISRNRVGCIAVTYVEWASPGQMRSVVPWSRICRMSDAVAVASVISEQGHRGYGCHTYCGTSISYAIDVGRGLLDGYDGMASKIIDISANGSNNDGPPVKASRLKAIASGYTINAIVLPPLSHADADLSRYFREHVIGGAGSFVIEPTRREDYAVALRRKLVAEISQSYSVRRNASFTSASPDH